MLSLDTDGQPSITVEYQPGFLLKKHHGKFDLPDEEEDEDEEGDEENEFAKDQTMTYTDSDIVDMRKVVEEWVYMHITYPLFTHFILIDSCKYNQIAHL